MKCYKKKDLNNHHWSYYEITFRRNLGLYLYSCIVVCNYPCVFCRAIFNGGYVQNYYHYIYGGVLLIMSIPLIVVLGLIYACLAVDLFLKGNTPLAVCYFSSVIGNFGAYMMVAK